MSTATVQQQAHQQAPPPKAEPAMQPSLISAVMDQSCAAIDALATTYAAAISQTPEPLRRAMILADGIERLRAALTKEVMARFMRLMNSRLGFKTDRPNKKNPTTSYSEAEVKDCLIEALLNGVFPVGNEFNIISGACYIAQAGYRRKVKELPGLTDLELSPGIPFAHNGATCVRVAATWRLNGVRQELMGSDAKPGRTFAIITTEYSSADATVGKAKRKAYAAIYEQVTGSELGLAEGEVAETPASGDAPPGPVNGKSRTDTLADRLAPPAAEGAQPGPPLSAYAADPPHSDDASQPAPAEVVPTQDEMAITDTVLEISEAIGAADDLHTLERGAGDLMHQHRAALGEERYASLLQSYQERRRQLEPRAATGRGRRDG